MKLEQEKKEFEEYKSREIKALEDKLASATNEITNQRNKFDKMMKNAKLMNWNQLSGNRCKSLNLQNINDK